MANTNPNPRRLTNKQVRNYVQRTERFMNNNGTLWSTWFGVSASSRYVVCSYGLHWPLFVYVPRLNRWFENEDKYGVTTSRHHSHAHPHTTTTKLSSDAMRLLTDHGYNALAERYVLDGSK